MYILGIESSAGPASAAVVKDGKIISEFYLNTGMTHSQTLMPMIDKALLMTSLKVSDMDLISVSCGPGSFTGVRIGVASAKGLAMPADIPCAGISSLEAIAYNFYGSSDEAVVCSLMDARCSQVYRAYFKISGGMITRLSEDKTVPVDEIENEAKNFGEKIVYAGDGAEICYNKLKDKSIFSLAQPSLMYQRASSVAFAGAVRKSEGTTETAAALRPIYLQLPQAQRELNKKKGKT